jgi:hypothetical protein
MLSEPRLADVHLDCAALSLHIFLATSLCSCSIR